MLRRNSQHHVPCLLSLVNVQVAAQRAACVQVGREKRMQDPYHLWYLLRGERGNCRLRTRAAARDREAWVESSMAKCSTSRRRAMPQSYSVIDRCVTIVPDAKRSRGVGIGHSKLVFSPTCQFITSVGDTHGSICEETSFKSTRY